ncbi:unnamed protein product [Paramecium octaurelia]|uniref:Uncharacterized protein n=1 Tax=Paramecium octaurelia TaxID=43137 RepID=A0A8S1TUU3_PAROT|nr:unnamed protein product [Paramecium octaurelia]
MSFVKNCLIFLKIKFSKSKCQRQISHKLINSSNREIMLCEITVDCLMQIIDQEHNVGGRIDIEIFNNNTRCVKVKGERILRKELKIHSSIIEFKQNFKNMITNSKYGLQYMKRKVFPKLQPL